MSVPLSRPQTFPRSPAVRFTSAARQTGKWLLLCASLGRGGGGATVKGGRRKKTRSARAPRYKPRAAKNGEAGELPWEG